MMMSHQFMEWILPLSLLLDGMMKPNLYWPIWGCLFGNPKEGKERCVKVSTQE